MLTVPVSRSLPPALDGGEIAAERDVERAETDDGAGRLQVPRDDHEIVGHGDMNVHPEGIEERLLFFCRLRRVGGGWFGRPVLNLRRRVRGRGAGGREDLVQIELPAGDAEIAFDLRLAEFAHQLHGALHAQVAHRVVDNLEVLGVHVEMNAADLALVDR